MDTRVNESWDSRVVDRARRRDRAATALAASCDGKCVAANAAVRLLEAVIAPGDRVCLEGNNQKQADFLAQALASVDARTVHRPAHGAVGAGAAGASRPIRPGHRRQARFLLFGPAGRRASPSSWRSGASQIGAIHTYLELFARYFVDLTPQVALVAAQAADRHGNLYTGPNTEDTPAIVEATAFKGGIVVAQVNEMVDDAAARRHSRRLGRLRRAAPRPHLIEPLFTRDPAQISEIQVLMAMMAIKGIYAEYGVRAPQPRHRLRHCGHRVAAADLRRIAWA